MKYVGSKAKISKFIVPILQDMIDANHIETYVEPFVGGVIRLKRLSVKTGSGTTTIFI